MAITNRDGTAYFDNSEILDVSDRDYFKAFMNGQRYISSIVSSRLDGKRTNVFSIPIYKNMEIVAEGIETEEQYKFLLECNCDMFQGYYFSKPMNLDDFSNLI